MRQRVTKPTPWFQPRRPRLECPGDDSIQTDLDRLADEGNPNNPEE